MKPDTRTNPITTKDTRETSARAVVPSLPTTDLEADLLAIAAEETALHQRKTQRRQQYWDQTIASLSLTIQQLISLDFQHQAIAKALGFKTNKPSTTPHTTPRPSTLDGWLSIFRVTGMRAYLKSHPDFAATLKTNKVKPSAYSSHLPADDLALLNQVALHKAQLKLSLPPTPEATT